MANLEVILLLLILRFFSDNFLYNSEIYKLLSVLQEHIGNVIDIFFLVFKGFVTANETYTKLLAYVMKPK